MTAGDLDTTFGTSGKATVNFGQTSIANAMAIQPTDGKIVLAGRVGPNGTGDWAITRLKPNGTLDTGFGSSGLVTINFTPLADTARAVAIDASGNIVIGGLVGSEQAGSMGFARLLPSGALDTTFGSGGTVTYRIDPVLGNAVRAMVIDPSGNILGVGAAGADGGLIRLTSSGALDTTFAGGAGKEAVSIGAAGHIFALTLLSSGKFVIAGFDTTTTTLDDFLVAQFTSTGALDTIFGTSGGFTDVDFNNLNDLAFGLGLQSTGKLVAGGDVDSADPVGISGDVKAGWARVTTGGVLDTTFGTSGKTQLSPTLFADGVRGLVVDSSDRIVSAGFIGETNALTSFADPVAGSFGVYRLTSAGAPDSTFGAAGVGWVRTTFDLGGDGARAVALQNNGRILAAGGATVTGQLNFAVARYLG
ncbi:delta-60 repeat domain-containing protein [Streptomyces sp. NPDC048717]|uniref:delta-60 repeat domain-containing protein n=1 Tax=Streptomyces sp. NPDC048717 TaxID=3154928 RepID=UPI003424CA7C